MAADLGRGAQDHLVTELRVHGVSGTPAESMLDRHIVGRVAGDGKAGFYRPREEYGATTGPGGARLEAYRWGDLTAGAATRAFWLLLLPFTLTNVALWLRPPSKGLGRAAVRGIVRVFALSVTATFTLAAVGIAFDLVAWQCAVPGSRCGADRPLLDWAFTGFFAPTGRRLALAALLPLGMIALLWELARRTWARYESYHVPGVYPDGDGLSAPRFWDGREQVGRLRAIHVGAALSIVDAVLLYVLLKHDLDTDAYQGVGLHGVAESTVVTTGGVLAGLAAAILGLSMLLLFLRPMVDRDSTSGWAQAAAIGLRWSSLLLTIGTLVYAVLPRQPWPTAGALPGYAPTVTYLFAGQIALLLLLMLVVLFQRHRAPDAMLAGFASPIVASMGLGLGGAFAAGVSYRVADFLDRGAVPSPADFDQKLALGLEPPVSYQWAAFGFVLAVIVVVLAGLWLRLVTLRGLRRKARADTDADFPTGRLRDRRRGKALDGSIAEARLTDHIGTTLGFCWALLGCGAVVVTGFALTGTGPVELAHSGSTSARALHIITNVGTYLISFTVVGLVVLGIQAYRNERVRRIVGVVWDLGTFWPRAAHPLAPPCYAERVVPELVHRATWLANEQGGVVLSGHSQGSVLAAATILQLPPDARQHTSLLTYGSPLRRLYVRLFPSYWTDAVLAQIGASVADPDGRPRWVNLWRKTDPIGGLVGLDDRRFVDPVAFDPAPGDKMPSAPAGHSGYQVSPGFGEVVQELSARLPARGAAPVSGQSTVDFGAVGSGFAASVVVPPPAVPPAGRP